MSQDAPGKRAQPAVMTPERWRIVDAVVQGALARAPAERARYLDDACGSDVSLRHEAESLIAAAATADSFLEHPASPRPLASGVSSSAVSTSGAAAREAAGEARRERTRSRLSAALGASYALERELGRGGMAVVYLARDLRQRRSVAIKVLDSELSLLLGSERFLREIELTASLQHPHILPLFDSGSAEGLLYYVMPYVAGETLRTRIAREGQLPIADAVRIASEVASALEYAHRHGIVHRDVKPENILLAEDGSVLVADFGIALAVQHAGDDRLTQTGFSLGTPQYMAPEQATAQPGVDQRADVYALGCVLYELLVGEPPFTGPNLKAILGRALTEPPRSIVAQRPSAPAHIDAAVRMALEKVPADRFASARAFADALAQPAIALAPSAATQREIRATPFRTVVSRWLPWAVAALAIASLALLSTRRNPPAAEQPTRFTLSTAASGDLFAGDAGVSVAISRDGRALAYTGQTASGRQLYLRSLGDLRATPLPHTDGALPPFFSPDGRWLAFGQGGRLMKLPLAGGDPVAVANVAEFGSWSSRGVIVVSGENGDGLRTVSANGAVKALTLPATSDGGHWHRMPLALSDSETVLYADYPVTGGVAAARIGIASLSTGAATTLDLPGVAPLGLVDGQLIYVSQDRQIMAVPLNLATRRVVGEPVPLVDQVLVGGNGLVAAALADNGTLVYVRDAQSSSIVLTGSDGGRDSIGAGQRMYAFPRFSPDGRRLAVAVSEGTTQDIWVFDLASKTSSRLTTRGTADRPEWTPDGRRIAYIVNPAGLSELWWQSSDGSGKPERVASLLSNIREVSFSPDGRLAVLRADTPRLQHHLWLVRLDGDRTPRPLVAAEFDAVSPRVSPGGRWLAYVSNESGQNEVYVRRFPDGGGRWAVSSGGGSEPVWAPDGRALFYRAGKSLVRIAIGSSAEFTVGRRDTVAREMVRDNYRASYFHAMYDVSRDGRRFAFVKSGSEAAELVAVLHFDALVRARARSR